MVVRPSCVAGQLLATAMQVHGVKRILPFNDRDFARYTDIKAIHPRAVLTK
jgi:hypothetical protein